MIGSGQESNQAPLSILVGGRFIGTPNNPTFLLKIFDTTSHQSWMFVRRPVVSPRSQMYKGACSAGTGAGKVTCKDCFSP